MVRGMLSRRQSDVVRSAVDVVTQYLDGCTDDATVRFRETVGACRPVEEPVE